MAKKKKIASVKKKTTKVKSSKASKKVSKKAKKTSSKKVSTKASKKKKASPKLSKKSSKLLPGEQLSLEVEGEFSWPKDRDIVWNPKRFKYLNQAKSDTCVFCAAANYGVALESLCIYKNAHAQVVLNKYPYHTGHIMVMPVRHVDEMDKLDGKEFIEIMWLVKFAASAVQKAYKAEGLNIGINLGRAAGAGIPGHLHWHIIPRWFGDTNFFPAIAKTRVISEDLETTYGKLKAYFSDVQSAVPGSGEWKQVEFPLDE